MSNLTMPCKSRALKATVLPDGRWLLYHQQRHAAITLSAPAGILWELCDGETSVDNLINKLQEYYPDINQHELETATRQTLNHFQEQGLLVHSGQPEP